MHDVQQVERHRRRVDCAIAQFELLALSVVETLRWSGHPEQTQTIGTDANPNVTAEFLRAGMYSALPASRVVLELLETTEFNVETADAMRTAAYHGYRFALDDLVTMSTPGASICSRATSSPNPNFSTGVPARQVDKHR